MSNKVGGVGSGSEGHPLKPERSIGKASDARKKEKLKEIYKAALKELKELSPRLEALERKITTPREKHGGDKDGVKEKKETPKNDDDDEWLDSPD